MASTTQDDLFGEDMGNDHIDDAQMKDDESDGGAAEDDRRIFDILNAADGDIGISLDGPIDQRDKADDAIDYEDLSDDDLPDEEPAKSDPINDVPGLTDDGGTNDTDDLFGEIDDHALDIFDKNDLALEPESESFDTAVTTPSPPAIHDPNFDPAPSAELTEEGKYELAKKLCPQFERGVAPYMLQWLSFMTTDYRGRKEIPKPPKPLTHPKISLEVAPDQERAFRSAGPAATTIRSQRIQESAARGIILELSEDEEVEEKDAFDYTPLEEDQVVSRSGLTVSQLRSGLCADFSLLESKPQDETAEEDAWLAEFGGQPRKKQKLNYGEFLDRPVYPVPSFDNYEELTAQIGRGPIFDLNDPYLLVTTVEEKPQNKRLLNGNLKFGGKKLLSRYNISNDEATDALKANNQSKVRAAIGNVAVEHSVPALKCAWPYYMVKRGIFELRAAHRMPLKFAKFQNQSIQFSKSSIRKKKHMKGLTTQQLYAKTTDLSLSDNASAMLLEYSEETPPVLSNFGMGNRIINYYRKANDDDSYRPKLDVGEAQILQPADESPFNKFGAVEPGQTVPTLHNSMYRAPVFPHEPKPNDFLVVRSSTGMDGTNWYLRKIDHLFAVGQEFPSVEVPGPHSRKVTTATRNRMMMLAYRMMNHNQRQEVKVFKITEHIQGSNDMQNRQKLKEFLKYDKDAKVWKLREGQTLPDEASIRSMIKPEDVCLIDAMQVGVRQLEDAGYDQTAVQPEGEGAEEDKAETTVQQLAPWKTTKAFLEASSGKAMLELKGEGDLSICGMHLSLIKTSMKGGFLQKLQAGPMGTSADAMEKQRKANGGHDYNVSVQEAKYAQVLDETWKKQKEILSDTIEHKEMDEDDEQEEAVAQTPGYAPTPSHFDDSVSMASGNAMGTKYLRIVRTTLNRYNEPTTSIEIVRNPRVAKAYVRRRALREADELE